MLMNCLETFTLFLVFLQQFSSRIKIVYRRTITESVTEGHNTYIVYTTLSTRCVHSRHSPPPFIPAAKSRMTKALFIC